MTETYGFPRSLRSSAKRNATPRKITCSNDFEHPEHVPRTSAWVYMCVVMYRRPPCVLCCRKYEKGPSGDGEAKQIKKNPILYRVIQHDYQAPGILAPLYVVSYRMYVYLITICLYHTYSSSRYDIYTYYIPGIYFHTSTFQLLDKPWSQVCRPFFPPLLAFNFYRA